METCEKLRRVVKSLEELRKIKTVGLDEWAEEMQKKWMRAIAT
jgi:hypothetical protein